MKKAFEIGRNVMAIWGIYSCVAVGFYFVDSLRESKESKKTESNEEETPKKKRGKTYFKVQKDNENHQTIGFHLS